jgi:hypothetical protein
MSKFSKVMDKCALIGYFIVSVCELVQGNWFSGVGWCLAGIGWFAFDTEKGFFDQANEIFRKCSNEYEAEIEKLEAEKLAHPKSGLDSSIINMENMDIDHILKVGRDFQNTDTWRGAHYDTVKLLCDTIEHLRKPGTRNCDVYRTVKEAEAACHEDRGYCSSAINERVSTIRFMLQDVKENAFNKSSSEGKEDNG